MLSRRVLSHASRQPSPQLIASVVRTNTNVRIPFGPKTARSGVKVASISMQLASAALNGHDVALAGGCHAVTPSPRTASMDRATREPSWPTNVDVARLGPTSAPRSVDSVVWNGALITSKLSASRAQNSISSTYDFSVGVTVRVPPSNYRMNPTVGPVTVRACARPAPGPPGGLSGRSTDSERTWE